PDTQAGDEDASAREPFVVWFSSPKTGVQDFVIIPIHRAPEAAVKEIDELYDVYQNVSQLWRSNISVSQSRFPAACGYVPERQLVNICLHSETEFVWLTVDKLDMSVKKSTRCAYHRVVLCGEKMIEAVNPESVEAFSLKEEFGLTDCVSVLRAVSDHFPLCITVNKRRREDNNLLHLHFYCWPASLVLQMRMRNSLQENKRVLTESQCSVLYFFAVFL
ncbi:deoxyribonuclease gamma-like, partial [Cyprinus carpio]|uniref:Deoxyribonuclease gamma-like n=1 Tax=Cyprinus carpio TaxID=7962 RepID=A0A9R0A8G9_CYPCA